MSEKLNDSVFISNRQGQSVIIDSILHQKTQQSIGTLHIRFIKELFLFLGEYLGMGKKLQTLRLPENMGKTVTVRGIARDAKGGAVLLPANTDPIYIEGLSSWPDEVLGKEVSVTGVLREKKLIPDPYIASDGGISQGAIGTQMVLEKATWKRI